MTNIWSTQIFAWKIKVLIAWYQLFQLWGHNLHTHVCNLVGAVEHARSHHEDIYPSPNTEKRKQQSKHPWGSCFNPTSHLFASELSLESSAVGDLLLSLLTHNLDKIIDTQIMGSLLTYLNLPVEPSSFLSQITMYVWILSLLQNCQELWKCWDFTQRKR